MGTKMLRGPSLKSLSLLRTFYLLQIMILTISGGKGCDLDDLALNQAKSLTISGGKGCDLDDLALNQAKS